MPILGIGFAPLISTKWHEHHGGEEHQEKHGNQINFVGRELKGDEAGCEHCDYPNGEADIAFFWEGGSWCRAGAPEFSLLLGQGRAVRREKKDTALPLLFSSDKILNVSAEQKGSEIERAQLRYKWAVEETERGGSSPALAQYLIESLAELRKLESIKTKATPRKKKPRA
jgi:hypothetical protein